jgi:hypothetical protein
MKKGLNSPLRGILVIAPASDPHQENAVFSFVEEAPVNTYTLQCVSKYACPVAQRPSSAPVNPTNAPHRTVYIYCIYGPSDD